MEGRRHLQAEIVKLTVRVTGQNRIAAENVGLQNAARGPVHDAIGRVSPAGLPEVAADTVELPPPNGHSPGVGRINAERRFICGVTDNVLPRGVHIHLVAGREWDILSECSRQAEKEYTEAAGHCV